MAASPEPWTLVVAGGGPAGFMAAIAAAEAGVPGVLLLESMAEPLGKVLISGGGRCNVTHACWDPRELVGHYPRGGRALRGPFSRFASGDAVAWFAERGLELVEEPDGRMFPSCNRSTAVIETLRRAARRAGVVLRTRTALQGVEPLSDGGFQLSLRQVSGEPPTLLRCERLVLATGSHPSGRRLAQSLGHGLVPPVPSLFTLALRPNPLHTLAGVSQDPVRLELELDRPEDHPSSLPPAGGTRFRQEGPVLITHWGLSGPATLRLTAFAARALHTVGYRAQLRVDWTGGRSEADLQDLFARCRREQARRQLATARPWPALSRRLWLLLLAQQGVDAQRRWADWTRREERQIIAVLRDSRFSVAGRGPFGEEFVTAGGVTLAELNLATMESRLRPGLHLVGELLDVDGVTGGFNFQHCWSSGWLAGQAAAAALLKPARPT
jgi:predicted Rossmann fold flavoprotein